MSDAMKGKTVLITGSSDGIGRQTALELARLGARVLIHGRDRRRGEAARNDIRSRSGNENLGLYTADFSSLDQTRWLAGEIEAQEKRLDVLINNAGVYMARRETTPDGFEMTFQVNHLAVFLLTLQLLDLLQRSKPSRVIVVSSMTHLGAALDFDDLQGGRGFDGYDAYARSKLCNVLFTFELAQRLQGAGVAALCLQPGVINTKLLRAGFSMAGDSLEAGARTPVWLARAPELDGVTGKYYSNEREATPSALAHDEEMRRRLWGISETMCGIGGVSGTP